MGYLRPLVRGDPWVALRMALLPKRTGLGQDPPSSAFFHDDPDDRRRPARRSDLTTQLLPSRLLTYSARKFSPSLPGFLDQATTLSVEDSASRRACSSSGCAIRWGSGAVRSLGPWEPEQAAGLRALGRRAMLQRGHQVNRCGALGSQLGRRKHLDSGHRLDCQGPGGFSSSKLARAAQRTQAVLSSSRGNRLSAPFRIQFSALTFAPPGPRLAVRAAPATPAGTNNMRVEGSFQARERICLPQLKPGSGWSAAAHPKREAAAGSGLGSGARGAEERPYRGRQRGGLNRGGG